MADVPHVQVACAIIWQDDKFLAAERPIDGPRGGYWEFPGGKLEPGETIEQTLVREVQEELGITCTAIIPYKSFPHTYPDLHVELFFMHVVAFTGEPQQNLGQKLAWITPKEALALNFLPADKKLLESLVPPKR